MEGRLPARIEVNAILRAVQSAGGFATVIAHGEDDAGTILVITLENGCNAKLYERLPEPGGKRPWHCTRSEEKAENQALAEYLERRRQQDPDLWIIELDIPQAERFIG